MAHPDDSEIEAITVDRDSHVEVVFADGKVCRFELLDLRVACPCATCRNRRDQGQPAWPLPGRPAAELAITDAEFVGAWGLGVTWNDGHSTGIYPFESLRRWCETGHEPFSADSGLSGPGG